MKRLLLLGLTVALVIGAAAFSHYQSVPKSGGEDGGLLRVTSEEHNPWTSLKLNNNPDEFRFCVVSDRTGGHRAEIFSRAVDQINLLQPEFVVSVGDLIEGYSEDKAKINGEWKEFDGYVQKLKMPFFYVPGNHDITNDVQDKIYKERYGRPYYHFVYRNVLFLALSSEEVAPPVKNEDPNKPDEKPKRGSHISDQQIAYIKNTLTPEATKDVRWILVFIHKPLWTETAGNNSNWDKVEKLLDGRNYTVFAGHVHRFQKFVRQGMNYYQLATTGGGSRLRGERYGEFDQIAWITMKKDGPVIANILLDGIYPENMEKIRTNELAVVPKTPRAKVYPTAGVLTLMGKPVYNANVIVWKQDEKTKKFSHIADALTNPDGSFILSTYVNDDGLPAGKFVVTVLKREPRFEPDGKPGKNVLPEKYSKTDTSGLEIEAKEGKNELNIDLK